MPLGPHILWPETAMKSAPSACTSSSRVRRRLRRVADEDRAALVRPGRDARRRRSTVPSEFETMFGRDDLHVPEARELVELARSAAVSSTGRRGSRRPSARDVLPGHEVRVVLELGREHDVTRASRFVQAQAYATRLSASVALRTKMISRSRRRVDEGAHLLARAPRAPRRALAELVDAAVDVRVRRLVELRHRVEHLARLLGEAAESRYASGLPWISCSKIGKSARSACASSFLGALTATRHCTP